MSETRQFTTQLGQDPKGRAHIPVPFDPDDLWGRKGRHHVSGTVEKINIRGVLRKDQDGFALVLGPAWMRDCGLTPGQKIKVVISPEGIQRSDLAPDVAKALDAHPNAGEFFDSLAQFYRKGYIRWIDATKRRPEVRAERIAKMIKLLKAGKKQRPR